MLTKKADQLPGMYCSQRCSTYDPPRRSRKVKPSCKKKVSWPHTTNVMPLAQSSGTPQARKTLNMTAFGTNVANPTSWYFRSRIATCIHFGYAELWLSSAAARERSLETCTHATRLTSFTLKPCTVHGTNEQNEPCSIPAHHYTT